MARNIIKSQSSVVGLQNGAAFSTIDLDLNLYNAVQDASFSISLDRKPLKQVGSQVLLSKDIFQQPNVELSLSYIPEPMLMNEVYGGLLYTFASTKYVNAFSGTLERSTNFYVLTTPNQENDAINQLSLGSGPLDDLTGWDAIAFGNCYLTSYGLSYAVGEFPRASTNYICSNVKFEALTGTSMESPAINLESGNNNEVGRCIFQFDTAIPNPIVVNPASTGSSVTLQNLQVGGQALAGYHFIQNLQMGVTLDRVSTYGLGSDYAYGRKAQLPAKGTFSVSSLVSGVNDGAMTGVLNNDSNYDFELVLEGSGKKIIYQIEGATLDSYTYGMPVNDQMTFDASFSFEVSETYGLRLSGHAYS